MTRDKMKQIRDHLMATGQAFCFVDGEIIDLAECSRYLAQPVCHTCYEPNTVGTCAKHSTTYATTRGGR